MTRQSVPFGSRSLGRLSFFLISVLLAMLSARLDAQGPQTTQVTDIVYRSDGTPASGTVLISWPNFTTADSKAVAAGRLSIALGAGGALSVGLVPNAGADPAGTYYKVTYQLDDGSNSDEFWSVPATGPTTIAAIRSRVVPSGVAMQVVSRQYVDDQLALKATDANIVHKTGNESIAGVKTFSASPVVPTPSGSTDAANKAYVDANAGGGGSSNSGAGAGVVNVITDCGAVGNGVTDDYTAIQNCINNNPGRHIVFPKRSAGTTGGGATNTDYYLSQQLVVSYNGTWLDGANPANWTGGVKLQFAAGVGGIRCDTNAYNCKLSNLMLDGQACYSAFTRTTYPDWRGTEALLRGNGADGIQLLGGEPRLENVNVQCFARHGIYLSGDSTIQPVSQPDFWYFDRVTVNSNGGNGIYANGGDSNAGVATMIDARSNAIYGVQDNSPLGNTWIGVGTHNNHNDQLVAGATQALTSASVTSNVLTLTTTAALANGVDTVGTWITTAGQVDSGFNTTCKVLTVNSGAKQLTCAFTHANGSTTGGTVGQSSTANVYNAWSAAGINGGCIGGSDQLATWIQPYIEAAQGIGNVCARLGQGTIVIGSNGGPGLFGDLAAPQPNWITGGNALVFNSDNGFSFVSPTNSQLTLTLQAGNTVDANELITFRDHLGVQRATFGWNTSDVFGMYDSVDGFFSIYKTIGGNVGIRGTTATEDVEVNKAIGRKFIVYGGDSTADVTIDNTGLATPAQITSTLATGTAPFAVTSTTPVANLTLAADTQLPAISTAGKVSDTALSSNIERKTNKNTASGYAGLDAGSKLAASQLPNPSASTLGGVQSKTCPGTDKLSAIGTDGIPLCSADQGGAGSGDSITVNGAAATDADFDDAAPAAPASSVNVRWQKDAATPTNVSANVPFGYGLGAATSNLVVSLTTCEAYRSADLTLTANTYADNVSCSLAAGTWLITSETTVKSPLTTAQKVTVKLWDGTTIYGSGEAAAPSQGAGLTGYVHIAVSKIVTLASTTTVKTSVASNAASIVDATPDDNGTGLTNTANAIHAVRIGN